MAHARFLDLPLQETVKMQSVACHLSQNVHQSVVSIAAIFELCSKAVCVKIYIFLYNYMELQTPVSRSMVSCVCSAKLGT
jgi:hypothetical protein